MTTPSEVTNDRMRELIKALNLVAECASAPPDCELTDIPEYVRKRIEFLEARAIQFKDKSEEAHRALDTALGLKGLIRCLCERGSDE